MSSSKREKEMGGGFREIGGMGRTYFGFCVQRKSRSFRVALRYQFATWRLEDRSYREQRGTGLQVSTYLNRMGERRACSVFGCFAPINLTPQKLHIQRVLTGH